MCNHFWLKRVKVLRCTISRALHDTGLYGNVARNRPFLKKVHIWYLLQSMRKNLLVIWENVLRSDVTKIEPFARLQRAIVWCKTDTSEETPYLRWNIVVAESYYWYAFYLRWESAINLELRRRSTSLNMIMTLGIRPKRYWNGAKTE